MDCSTHPTSVGSLWQQRGAIDEEPTNQREGDVWSQAKKDLFIDSVIQGFDIPKIYLNDLRHDQSTNYDFAIIDGKQRLTTLWQFMNDEFPLNEAFLLDEELRERHSDFGAPPTGGLKWTEFTDEWKQFIRDRQLSVVHIGNASNDDIEEMFERLNNGEPLNGAEARNNINFNGDMTTLIRELPDHRFFTEKVRVSRRRYKHREIAAKFLMLEFTEMRTSNLFADLKKSHLDSLCRDHPTLTPGDRQTLKTRVENHLNTMCRFFEDRDPLLKAMSAPPLYYVWSKLVVDSYAHEQLFSLMQQFLVDFEVTRVNNRNQPEDHQDASLTEYTRLMQQATNDKGNIEWRASFLTKQFLLSHPEVRRRDRQRSFTTDERYVIWVTGNKQCSNCGDPLESLDDMQADHEVQWSWGGETSFDNARSLCPECNQGLKQAVG